MFPPIQESARAIYGTIRLARMDRTGIEYFEATPEGALRSFHVAALVAPAYVLMMLIQLIEIPYEVDLVRYVVVETIAYVIAWTAFPVLVWQIAPLLGRQEAYFRFLTAFNWAWIPQMAVQLAAAALAAADFVPAEVSSGIALGVTFAILCYQWFIIRTGLDVTGGAALGLLVVNLTLDLTNFYLSGRLALGG